MIDFQIDKSKLASQLKNLPLKVERRVVVGATRKGANVIAREMRKRAPVRKATGNPGQDLKYAGDGEFPRSPGFLKKSIRSKKDRKRNNKGAVFHIGPVGYAYYGLMLEKGTSTIKKQEWMRPAFNAKEKEAAEMVMDSFWKGLEKELSKL